jgi:hypothetical protein
MRKIYFLFLSVHLSMDRKDFFITFFKKLGSKSTASTTPYRKFLTKLKKLARRHSSPCSSSGSLFLLLVLLLASLQILPAHTAAKEVFTNSFYVRVDPRHGEFFCCYLCPAHRDIYRALLHYGGFCKNCIPKQCLHISVYFETNPL